MAEAYYNNRDYDAVVTAAERAISANPDNDYAYAHFIRAIACDQQNRSEQASFSLSECMRIRPDYVQNHPQLGMYKAPGDRAHIIDGLRKAGVLESSLPE